MLRRIRKILAILSLLLALTTAILWLRSYGKPFHFSKENQKSIDRDRELYRNFEFHSLDAGYVSIGYVSAIVDYSQERAERERMRKKYPDITDIILNSHSESRLPSFQHHATPPKKTVAGFSFDYGSHQSNRAILLTLTGKWIRISLPHWFLVVLLSLPGIVHATRRFKRRLRHRRGLCSTCGYDLRGSKDICPECGATTGKSAAPAR
jgi:hypothetical protein